MHLSLYIQPGAKKTEISGTHDGRLKIRVNAPPVDGAANEALIKFLSKELGIAKSRVTLVSGEKSRMKTFDIDMDEAEVNKKLGVL